MKTSSIVIIWSISLFSLQAQVATTPISVNPVIDPSANDYSVVAQDGNSRVWQRTSYDLDANGVGVPKVHSYVELQAGVNHLVNGQWLPSTEEIAVLPDGSAAATNCQHQVYFPGDIYQGAITVVTPDQQILQSRPFILCYTDGSNIQVLGGLTNSLGEFLSTNQVVYPNAFNGIKADIRYSNAKGGVEQDIILREQPPSPAQFGLDPAKTRIEVMTEFFDSPTPEVTAGVVDEADNIQDSQLNFGSMRMALGKAFATAAGQQGVTDGATVFKDWINVQGRTFLVEKLPYQNIAQQLQTLPLHASVRRPASSLKMTMATPSSNFTFPPAHSIKPSNRSILLAKTDYNRTPGVVLDYVLLGSTVGSYTFQADTTYLMTGSSYFEIDGLATLEGGAVIKFSSTTAGFQLVDGGISCLSGPYRPIIMTAQDDNTVGETVAGSTGIPSGYYGNGITMYEYNNPVLHDIRMSYLNVGLNANATTEFDNMQFINCNNPITHAWVGATFNNCLFYNIAGIAVQSTGAGTSVSGTQLTIDNCNTFADSTTPSLSLANSLVTTTTNLLAGTGTLTTNKVTILASNSGVFQTVGAGSHYLANGSSYRGAGTNNISATILASLSARTTYPPLIYSNQVFSVSTNLQPQALRDTNSAPDLGYHYDPLDYITDNQIVTNATLTLTNGVAVACYNEPGILLRDGSAIVSTGTPNFPNWLVRYQSVQDRSVFLGGTNVSSGQNVSSAPFGGTHPNGTFQFTHFATPANGGFDFNHNGNSSFNILTLQHSELWGGTNNFSGPSGSATASLLNNLFFRSGIIASNSSATAILSFTNNTIYGTVISLIQPSGGSWYFFNNDVDTCTVLSTSAITNGYNAFINCSFNFTGTSNIVTTNAIGYQIGALGGFYQPTNSPLINAGSITSDQLGLNYYTTQTNQMVESNSVVDIGYHYVALGTNGLPLTDTNGIPLYLGNSGALDPDGSGLPIWWEMLYFGHTGVDPNAYATGDGLTNLQKYQAGLNPNVDASTISSARLNYIYDAGGWLNQVTGIHSGTVTPDNEGNIGSSSQ